MQITGLSLSEFKRIVEKVSKETYEGNVIVAEDAHELSGNRFVARLKVASSRESGARRSWSGRRMPAACWHAYRDVLCLMFTVHPSATARTAMAVYKGMDGFADKYPATGCQNIGSIMSPAYMPELCECA